MGGGTAHDDAPADPVRGQSSVPYQVEDVLRRHPPLKGQLLNGEKVLRGWSVESHSASPVQKGLRYAAAGYRMNCDIARTLHSARFFIEADAA